MARFKLFKRESLSLGSPQKWFDLFGGSTTASGSKVDEETSLKFTGVLAAVSLRSELVASFPKEILINKNGSRSPDFNDPLYKLLAYQPNQFMNAFTFWELNNMYLDLHGNAYNYISRSKGQVVALTPIHPDNVEIRTEDKLIYRCSNSGRVINGDHGPGKILHFKDLSLDGVKGRSRILLAREAIGLGLAAEKFGGEFFGNGTQARGVLQHPGTMGEEAYNNFVKSWKNKDNLSTPIIEEGMTYNQITIPPEQAQFIASREFQLQDIARVFRVPSHLVNDLSRATFSNIEHQDISFVKYTLRPLAKRYEQELELKLLGDDLGKKNIRFNLEGILRGDTATRAEYLSKMVSSMIMNRNEARAVENLPPVEGGDDFVNPNTSTEKTKQDED